MASLYPGFEYDIFISYRQKDNKNDGWVTEFVSNLRKELETTFKEDISIYFDLNTHDGLLGTHHVEKSLEGKLNCLIMIPILSHTYCDQNSYAWKFEFCAFNKLSAESKIGKDVKLMNGNVTSRILPVKIHQLDTGNLKLIQDETGSTLRSIDFVYKEPGVNRPLRPGDERKDNANKTDYRNQINKVANAIKEIIDGVKKVDTTPFVQETERSYSYSADKGGDKSIAVLPFLNLSNDVEQDYFSEGIAEEIINSLVHIHDLKVAGSMSSMQFRGTQSDLRDVGAKLGVRNVLVGSVRKQDQRLRVTVQLTSVENGFNLWSEKYDRNMNDVFAIQDEVAYAITEKLKVTLLGNDRERIARNHTRNQEAYEAYLKGRYMINKRGEGILKGLQHFKRAIELDPKYALAHAGFADANLLIASYGLAPPRMLMGGIKQSAQTAIEHDPYLSEPFCSLGYYYTCFERNWKEAKKYFLKSLELNPRNAQAHCWYGWNYLLWVEGNLKEAENHGRLAISIEPLSSLCYAMCSLILRASGNLKEALSVCQKGIELDSGSYLCQLNEGQIYLAMKEFALSASSFELAVRISNRHHFAVNGLIWAHCHLGNIDQARVLMAELKERGGKEYVASTFTGISSAHLNDIDFAFECLEKGYNDLDPIILTVKNEPWFPASMRKDPRFTKVIEKLAFPKLSERN